MIVDANVVTCAALLVVIYAFIANRLFYFGGRLRTRSIELGTAILDDTEQTQDVKDGVERMLLTIPRTSQAWLIAAIVMPSLIMFLHMKWTGKQLPQPKAIPAHKKSRQFKDWDEFSSLAIAAALCNSPAAALIFVMQLFFGSFVISMNVIAGFLVGTLVRHDGLVTPQPVRIR